MRLRDPELNASRRLRIIKAALCVLVRKGLYNVTMADIAAEAEMSPANLYHYFASKEAIIVAYSEQERQRLVAAIDGLDWETDPIDGILATVDFFLRNEDVAEFILSLEVMGDVCRNPSNYQAFLKLDREVIDVMAQRLERARAKGFIDAAINTAAAAHVILGTVEGVFWRRCFDDEFNLDANLTELRRMLHGYLCPKNMLVS